MQLMEYEQSVQNAAIIEDTAVGKPHRHTHTQKHLCPSLPPPHKHTQMRDAYAILRTAESEYRVKQTTKQANSPSTLLCAAECPWLVLVV